MILSQLHKTRQVGIPVFFKSEKLLLTHIYRLVVQISSNSKEPLTILITSFNTLYCVNNEINVAPLLITIHKVLVKAKRNQFIIVRKDGAPLVHTRIPNSHRISLLTGLLLRLRLHLKNILR